MQNLALSLHMFSDVVPFVVAQLLPTSLKTETVRLELSDKNNGDSYCDLTFFQ